ncbi:MAG: peptide chain release factor N(5)-glutamine methyltransferase [Thermodesulfobacteriota bacterium]
MTAVETRTAPAASSPWTILRLIQWTSDYLSGKGSSTPRLDAEVLLADLLNLDRIQLYLNFEKPLQPDELASFRQKVKRRAALEPVAYIIGRKEFYGLELRVGPEVLIPRPETELLVEETLALVRGRWPELVEVDGGLALADLGAGSGAVALALARHMPGARIYALDVSPQALALARANAERHGLAGRIFFHQGDLFAPLAGAGLEFQAIAANLPYVPRPAFRDMPVEVRQYEPRLSLDGGEDGLAVIQRAVLEARDHLAADGALLLEIWPDQAGAIRDLAAGRGYPNVKIVQDLAGRDRVAILDAKA